ncbi:MAG TPA: DUF5667 domain-containing protein [Jatrophihabitans sp.]|nr:DUF5667 domain-containing protein [Jatrophihabitans sp.]
MSSARFSAGPGHRAHGRGRPVERDLLERLRQLPSGPGPDPQFTRELRAQLVAITPSIVAESAAQPVRRRPERPAGLLRRARRPLIAIVSATAVLVSLLGLAVWVSHNALPGQSLYGLKRASENFSLSLAGSDTGKGKAYLEQATSRATETTKLLGNPSGHTPLSGELTKLLGNTLQNADSDTKNGMQLLGKAAVDQHSSAPIAGLPNWVSAQSARLAALQSRLPAGSARTHAQSSLALLQRVATRLAQWRSELGCSCLSATNTDELGPKPCPSCVASGQQTPGLSGLPTLPTGQLSGTPSLLPSLPLPGLGGSAPPTGKSGTQAAGTLSAPPSSAPSSGLSGAPLPPMDGSALRNLLPSGSASVHHAGPQINLQLPVTSPPPP